VSETSRKKSSKKTDEPTPDEPTPDEPTANVRLKEGRRPLRYWQTPSKTYVFPSSEDEQRAGWYEPDPFGLVRSCPRVELVDASSGA
jgi:hypothetical protein